MNVSTSNTTVIQSTRQPTQLQKEKAEPAPEAQEKPNAVAAKKSALPAPMVNAQGQTTGRLLNVTA